MWALLMSQAPFKCQRIMKHATNFYGNLVNSVKVEKEWIVDQASSLLQLNNQMNGRK